MKKDHIPRQVTGDQVDASSSKELLSDYQAELFFKAAVDRLLHVSQWTTLMGSSLVNFELTNEEGVEVLEKAREGLWIKVSIPGPSASSGDGYDWVRIERIRYESQENGGIISMTLRPTSNPTSNDPTTAHFLANIATSTLLVMRQHTQVSAEFYGRNEVANLEGQSVTDKVRNFVIGTAGKWGASYPIWKRLTEGLLEGPPRD